MTPAERDEVRMLAQLVIDSPESSTLERMQAAANLRYVPAGDAAHENVRLLLAESILPPHVAVGGSVMGESWLFGLDDVRLVAHALHAAADAAEEK